MRKKQISTTKTLRLGLLIVAFSSSNSLYANDGFSPSVDGTIINWSGSGYFQVQNLISFESKCEGNDLQTCDVKEAGTYVVINHTENKRSGDIIVGAQRREQFAPRPTILTFVPRSATPNKEATSAQRWTWMP